MIILDANVISNSKDSNYREQKRHFVRGKEMVFYCHSMAHFYSTNAIFVFFFSRLNSVYSVDEESHINHMKERYRDKA